MGYVSKDIAVITEPNIVTLAGTPNFVQFASKPSAKTFLELNIRINVRHSTNWFNPTTALNNHLISWQDGDILPSVDHGCSDYLPVSASTMYSFIRNTGQRARGYDIFYYNSDKEYLYGGNAVQSGHFTTPPDAGFIRINLYLPDEFNTYGLFVGNNPVWEDWFDGDYSVIPDITTLEFTNQQGDSTIFKGTAFQSEVGANTFFVAGNTADTAENLRQVLLADGWLSSNFDIVIPFDWQGNSPVNGSVINIKSKDAGIDYYMTVTTPNDPNQEAYSITWISSNTNNNDSISGEESTTEIDLDIYVNPDVFLGQDDRPVTAAKLGTYVTTLQKTYAGVPVWFELNALFSQYADYNLPPVTVGWSPTGTARSFRFTAKVKGINSYYFYQSNALYVLNGYAHVTDRVDLSQYVYENTFVKLLTNRPRTGYMRGQKEYLNFIFSDPQRGVSQPIDFTLQVIYRAYTTGDSYLGVAYGQEQKRAAFSVVNTCLLDIDSVLDQFPNAGIIRVALARGAAIVSTDIEYTIYPECLHTIRQFSFINRLGGWDAFNFDSAQIDEIKPSVETYSKTLTPDLKAGHGVEAVYETTLANTFTVQGAPVTDEVAGWLKELAGSRVVLDEQNRYIIIEDFTLQVTAATKNMQLPTIKYRLSE